jgi:hypothetical protein
VHNTGEHNSEIGGDYFYNYSGNLLTQNRQCFLRQQKFHQHQLSSPPGYFNNFSILHFKCFATALLWLQKPVIYQVAPVQAGKIFWRQSFFKPFKH